MPFNHSHQSPKLRKKTVSPVVAYMNFAIPHVVTPLVLDSYNAGPDMSMANAAVGLTRRPTGSPSEFPTGTSSQMLKSPFKMQSSRAAKASASTCKACVRWFALKATHYDCKMKDSTFPFLCFPPSFQSTI